MDEIKKARFFPTTRIAGVLIFIGMAAGILSVAPAVDSQGYLFEASSNSTEVIYASVFQFIMAMAYIVFAVLLYPFLKHFNSTLALGFLCFRIIAATLVVFGALVLLSIVALSHEAVRLGVPEGSLNVEILGNILKSTRDNINHVFMILVLCAGNLLLYMLLIKAKLIPRWISIWGITGALLSALASFLLLFRAVEVFTPGYLFLNVPAGLFELIFAFWLITKGFKGER